MKQKTYLSQITSEQLDKKLLPLITSGNLRAKYNKPLATTFYSSACGRVVAMTCAGKHYSQVQA